MNASIDLKKLLPAWIAFAEKTSIRPIRNAADYKRMTAILEALLHEAAGDEKHPAMDLIDVVGDLIADYESRRNDLPIATGLQALKYLMQQHEIAQHQIPEIGSQGVVSEILSGKRELNIRQVRDLATRFGVTADTFI